MVARIDGVGVVLDEHRRYAHQRHCRRYDGDGPMLVTVQRGDTTFDTEITPFYDEAEGKYRLGVTVGATYDMERQRLGFLASVQNSWANCVYAGGAIFNGLKDLVTTGAGLDQTAGPVGMISMISDHGAAGGLWYRTTSTRWWCSPSTWAS